MGSDGQEKNDALKEAIIVDTFHPEDAEGIVRLFHAVYGEKYPIRLFYDPAAIIIANGDGRYYSIVARTASDEVIGVDHLFPSSTTPCLFEAGVGMVLKQYRNSGANSRMLGFLYNDVALRIPRLEEIYGEAVCNHPYMQKTLKGFNHAETAIQVALMPAETYNKESNTGGRVATLNMFRCYHPKPHRVFLPAAYEKVLRWIYEGLDDTRYPDISTEKIPRYAQSLAQMSIFDFAGVARIAVEGIGEEFRSHISDLEDEARKKDVVVFQVWLPATTPWIGQAVDILRDAGYFFGGALPRWFDGDGLLMQKLDCPPYFEGIVLESDFAKELLEIIKDDWKRVNH